jgi:AhpD family alkylhydroperoxidase
MTHPFEPPRMRIAKAAPAPHRALIALSKSIELDQTLRELVNLRASIINGCAYCIETHSKDARQAGESEQRLYALAAWRDAPLFDDRERAALALTDAITLISDEQVPRAVWDEAAAQFSEDELAQLLWAITAINAWNRIAIATRMESPYQRPLVQAAGSCGQDKETEERLKHLIKDRGTADPGLLGEEPPRVGAHGGRSR